MVRKYVELGRDERATVDILGAKGEVIGMLQEVTGRCEADVVGMYIESRGDHSATVDSLGVREEPREERRPSPDRGTQERMQRELIRQDRERLCQRFASLLDAERRDLRKLRDVVSLVVGDGEGGKRCLPGAFAEEIRRRRVGREEVGSVCEGLVEQWEGLCVGEEARGLAAEFVGLLEKEPLDIRRLRTIVLAVRKQGEDGHHRLPRVFAEAVGNRAWDREDLAAICGGLVGNWEKELFVVGES